VSPRPTTSRAGWSRPCTRRTPAPAATAPITWSSHFTRKTLPPALRAADLRNWDDVHRTCSRFGVVPRAHGNGLVFEDAERGIVVKASSIARQFSKPRLCVRFGDFQPASARHLEASRHAHHRYPPMPRTVPQNLWTEYTQSLSRARLQRQEARDSYRKNQGPMTTGLAIGRTSHRTIPIRSAPLTCRLAHKVPLQTSEGVGERDAIRFL
jgi:hypothetical protein